MRGLNGVRSGGSSVVPSAESSDVPRADSSRVVTPVDAQEAPRRPVIVIGRRDFGLTPPQLTGAGLRGTLPSGESWSEASVTPDEARSLEAKGAEVVENAPMGLPEGETPALEAPPGFNAMARDIHGVDELARRGPEWEGEGGLFICIDTGVAVHKDLNAPARFDSVYTPAASDPQHDGNGHGTHVYGSALAHGDPESGGTRGMAPRATGMAIQVLGDNGRGNTALTLKGIERAVEWAKEWDGPVVVGISISGKAGDPARDPVVRAINDATRRYGILFTISAGNKGRDGVGTIGTPGTAGTALTIGAMNHNGTTDIADDAVADFSSRDVPTGAKPNVTARGVRVRSTYLNDGYAFLNGTSMAQPVAGGGLLAVLTGLEQKFVRGEISVSPRELVRRGEFQRMVEQTAQPLPGVPRNVGGAGDLRLVALADAVSSNYKRTPRRRPAPYYPRPTPPRLRYTTPF